MMKFEKHVTTLKHSIAQPLQQYKREGRQAQLPDSGADTLPSPSQHKWENTVLENGPDALPVAALEQRTAREKLK